MIFSDIKAYSDVKEGFYKTIPDDFDSNNKVCDFTPAATCERLSSTEIRFTLTADGTDTIKGKIGKIKNPFST